MSHDRAATSSKPAGPTSVRAVAACQRQDACGTRATRVRRSRGFSSGRTGQRGVALVVALILLLVITLVGLAAVRGTIMQQKMASNLYDRQVAFQSSEAALRVAAELVTANPKSSFIRDCSSSGGNVCLTDPFVDPNLPAGSLQDVGKGSALGQFTASTIATGQPQFVVENMGKFDPTTQGLNQTANARQYGSPPQQRPVFLRITARSGDPLTVGDRAVVTLQSMVKQ